VVQLRPEGVHHLAGLYEPGAFRRLPEDIVAPVVQREAGEGGIITAPRDPDQMRLFAFESGRLEVCVAEFNSVGHWVNCLGN
jgi:hypothetical protein